MHQIGDRFTRLTPSIDFAVDAKQAHTASTYHPSRSTATSATDSIGAKGVTAASDDILGATPERFAGIHAPALLNAWLTRLQAVLADPVQLEQNKGHRRVSVLGTAIFDFDPDGDLRVYAWAFDENDRVMLTELSDHTVVIQGTPYQALWMQGFKLGAWLALRQNYPGQSALCHAYVDWAQAELETLVWTQEVQDRVRYQVAVALDLDPWAVDMASRIQDTAQPRLPMRAEVYRHCVVHAEDYKTLQKEAPQLIELFALLAHRVVESSRLTHPELTAWMQHMMLSEGVKPAMWRLLCQVGTDWMKEFLAYYSYSLSAAASDVLKLAQAFGTQQLVPVWLLHAVIQLGGNPNAPSSDIAAKLDDLFGLCKRLGQLAAQADAATLALLKDRAQEIFGWASDHLKYMPKDFARRVTLQGLLRRVDEQHRLDALKHERRPGWVVPYSLTLAPSDVQAVILDSPLAIWQEGQRMRHCAGKYIRACEKGVWVMVSLRSPQHSRPLATIAFAVQDSEVIQKKISGFANTLVSPQVQDMAQSCRRQLLEQSNRQSKSRT